MGQECQPIQTPQCPEPCRRAPAEVAPAGPSEGILPGARVRPPPAVGLAAPSRIAAAATPNVCPEPCRREPQTVNLHIDNSHAKYHSSRAFETDTWAQHNCAHPCELVCGTSLDSHTNPNVGFGGIKGGLLDIDGNGRVDCEDVQHACFFKEHVEPHPVPMHTEQEFMDLQTRHAVVVAAEALLTDPALKPDDLGELANHSKLDPHELHKRGLVVAQDPDIMGSLIQDCPEPEEVQAEEPESAREETWASRGSTGHGSDDKVGEHRQPTTLPALKRGGFRFT